MIALHQKLALKQTQKLVITPQLRQSIALLQLTNLELNACLGALVEANPLLQLDEDDANPSTDEHGDDESNQQDAATNDDGNHDGDAHDDAHDADPPLNHDPARTTPRSGYGDGVNHDAFDVLRRREKNLVDHLAEQVGYAFDDPAQRLIGRYLVSLVDERGYLVDSVDQVAATLDVSVAEIEAVLDIIHGFDPPGIMARSVDECLRIQLRERGTLDAPMAVLLDHLDRLAKHDFITLQRLCGLDQESLRNKITELRLLNPKPGHAYYSGENIIPSIVPDIFVRARSDGEWDISLNNDHLPRLLFDRSYYHRISLSADQKDQKDFITTCFNDAKWIIKSIDQRARTILRVAVAIIRHQDAFLLHGIDQLRPLTLRQIADNLELHESTISRVVANKYIATPRGTLPMKAFFSAALSSTDGGDGHATASIRMRIKTLIEQETTTSILSDNHIVDLLQRDGIKIARRTVAKYREASGFPSASQRRRRRQNPF